jgi:hypothetical protein
VDNFAVILTVNVSDVSLRGIVGHWNFIRLMEASSYGGRRAFCETCLEI